MRADLFYSRFVSPTHSPTQLERKIKFDLILVQIGSFFLGQNLSFQKRHVMVT